MERLLEMKRKNTVFVDMAITGKRIRTKAQNDHPRLGFMCICLKCDDGGREI